MANNAVISISANIMTVQSMQGSIANFWWFSIGVQQWGKIKANSNKVEFVYPLQIDVLLSISLIREQDYNANSASAFLVRTHDNTKAILNLVTASTVAYAYVFLVAIQQWGTTQGTVVFPLNLIQFVNVYCTNNCPQSNTCSYAMNASNLTLTGFQMRTASNPAKNEVCAWLAVGI